MQSAGIRRPCWGDRLLSRVRPTPDRRLYALIAGLLLIAEGARPTAGVQPGISRLSVVCPGVLPRWRLARDVPGGSAGGAEAEALARVTAPFRSGPGPAGGCRRA